MDIQESPSCADEQMIQLQEPMHDDAILSAEINSSSSGLTHTSVGELGEVQILKNEVEWSEKQQLKYEDELIGLKTVVADYSKELQKVNCELISTQCREGNLKTILENYERERSKRDEEMNKITEELYSFKKKMTVLNNQYNKKELELTKANNETSEALRNVEQLKKELAALESENDCLKAKLKPQEDISEALVISNAEVVELKLEMETKCAELLDLKERVVTAEAARESMQLDLTEKTNQLEHLQQSQEETLDCRIAAQEREQSEQQAWEQRDIVLQQLDTLEREVVRLYAVNKELREQTSSKLPAAASSRQSGHANMQQFQRTRQIIRSHQAKIEELHMQLTVSQCKVCKLELELREHGIHPTKKKYLQPTVASQSKHKTPANKENVATATASRTN